MGGASAEDRWKVELLGRGGVGPLPEGCWGLEAELGSELHE